MSIPQNRQIFEEELAILQCHSSFGSVFQRIALLFGFSMVNNAGENCRVLDAGLRVKTGSKYPKATIQIPESTLGRYPGTRPKGQSLIIPSVI